MYLFCLLCVEPHDSYTMVINFPFSSPNCVITEGSIVLVKMICTFSHSFEMSNKDVGDKVCFYDVPSI